MEDAKPTTVVKLSLADLRPHPRQAELFTNHSAAEDEALAKDLQENGLDHPIEVLPDMTIIAGHRRVAVAKAAGWKEIDGVVRHDLAQQGEQAILLYLVRDNAQRRQLSVLERARCAFHLKKLAAERCNRYTFDHDKWAVRQNTRDWVGAALGISGREATRLLNLLETPREVQTAFEDGQLTLVLAGRVAQLDREAQARIAQEIREGKPAKAVVESRVAQTKRRDDCVMPAYRKLLKNVEVAVGALSDRTREVEVVTAQVDQRVETLKRGASLLQALIEHELATRQRREERMNQLRERLDDLKESS